MEQCQVDQPTHFGSHKEENKKKGPEGSFEEIIAEKSPNLMKTTNLRHYNQIVLQRILKSTR